MKNRIRFLETAFALFIAVCPTVTTAREAQSVIISPQNASPMEKLAAREVRRYVYLRTGRLLPILTEHKKLQDTVSAIVVAKKDRPIVTSVASDPQFEASLQSLNTQSYLLKTISTKRGQVLLLVGGDDVGTLYAAYRFAEDLGIRFYLHGDVIPDKQIEWKLPVLDEQSKPLFALRGIQPFHDFPEGPDWWNTDDYLAIIGQLPKLRMNFIGLHTYPEGHPNAEPTVWIGLPQDIGPGGKVKFSYPASYQNTLRGNWGYAPKKTSDFLFGSAELFEHDAFGCDAMLGHCPQPEIPADCNEVFERTATMLRRAFQFAHELGVKTCVGTETPLVIPKSVQEHLVALGKNPTNTASVQELHEGIFQRAAQAYPLDYFWLWTPETWTWRTISEAEVRRTTNDLFAAVSAAKKISAPFQLATCGWVLGPAADRAMFGKILPPEVAISCINRHVGNLPVDRGFAEMTGRSKWAVPWLEDDGALTSPQFWAARMRRDAADALKYGCDGLMGIHWRTRVLSPNVGALAQAAWNQSAWLKSYPGPTPTPPTQRVAGPVGGQCASFLDHPIAGTEDDPLYQTVRYDLAAYRVPMSNGPCNVTLKFCELFYNAAALRVFDVKLQGKTVLKNLDVFARVGQNRALDCIFTNIAVTNGWLDIDFVPHTEFPCIAAIAVEGNGGSQKINCGGPAYKDYIADPPGVTIAKPTFPSAKDFYADWAEHEVGRDAAAHAAAIFLKLDCATPRPSTWVNGPGGIQPDGRPWAEVKKQYAFVDAFAALESRIKGAGARERFDYWLNTFRFMRANAEVNCLWAEYNRAMEKVKAEKNAATQKQLARELALPLRQKLVRKVNDVFDFLLATVSTTGELGTVANWNQHILPGLLTKPGEELAQILGEALPADAQPAKEYHGPTRVIVPTVCSSLHAGQPLKLKVIVLSEELPRSASLYWRQLGQGRFAKLPLQHVARGVYSVEIPSRRNAGDLEYYVEVKSSRARPVYFPATAPKLNQTVATLE